MQDFSKRLILPLDALYPRLRRGELVNVFLDLETGGIDRQNVPYATPNHPFITEFAATTSDLHSNYLQTKKTLVKQPQHLEGDIMAEIVTNLGGTLDWKSDERLRYDVAMAEFVNHLREQALSYGDIARKFGDLPKKTNFRDYNKAFGENAENDSHGRYKNLTGTYFDIPALNEHGEIVYPARYYPDRQMAAVKFTRDVNDQETGENNLDYAYKDNGFHIDQNSGDYYYWVIPSLGVDIFNAPYDTKVFASNLMRAGYAAQDAVMLHSRSRRGPRQEPRWYVRDVRELARLVEQYGPKGETGFQAGQLQDLATGKIKRSERQGIYIDANTRSPNPMRLIDTGIISPEDGSLHDKHKDHIGEYDTLFGSALNRHLRLIDPALSKLQDQMAERDNQDSLLHARNPKGEYWPLFCLPVKHKNELSDAPYIYLGNDSGLGDMGKRIFLRLDTPWDKDTLSRLSAYEAAEYIRKNRNTIRLEKKGELPLPVPYDIARRRGSTGGTSKSADETIKDNLKFIGENPHIIDKILSGVEAINYDQRFHSHTPAALLPEDEYYARYASGVNFQDYYDALRNQERMAGDKKIAEDIRDIRNTIKDRMDDDFTYMRKVTNAIALMAIRAAPIDIYEQDDYDAEFEKDQDGHATPKAKRALKAIREYRELVERQYKDVLLEQNGAPYIHALHSIKADDGTPFFKEKKFTAYTLKECHEFKNKLRQRLLNDLELLLQDNPEHPYLQGLSSTDDITAKIDKHSLILLPDPSPGEKSGTQIGAPPFIVDTKTGRRIMPEDIAELAATDSGRIVLKKIVNEGSWKPQFYSFRASSPIKTLITLMMEAGQKDEIPNVLKPLYYMDYIHTKLGVPNERISDSRIHTLKTRLEDIDAILAASSDPRIIERAPENRQNMMRAILQDEAAMRLVAEKKKEVETEIKRVRKIKKKLNISSFDPETETPLDYIEHEINRNTDHDFLNDPNFVVLDIPTRHSWAPIRNLDADNGLHIRGLVIPNIPAEKIDAIKSGKTALFRCIETGQIYSGGKVSIGRKQIKNTGGLQDIFEAAHQHYENSDQKLRVKDKLHYLEIEDLYPLAGTKRIDLSQQSLILPHHLWYSMTAPEIFDNATKSHITTVIAPADYLKQRFIIGDAVNLFHSDVGLVPRLSGEIGDLSGQLYESTLQDTIGINKENGAVIGETRYDIENWIRHSDLDRRYINGAGFMNADHFVTLTNEWAASLQMPEPDAMKLVGLTFERVNKTYNDSDRKNELQNSWAFTALDKAPDAALCVDGHRYTRPDAKTLEHLTV